MTPVYISYLGSFSDGKHLLKAYLVNAAYIRRNFPNGIDFFAGHHEAYSWIPSNEIWIDSYFPLEEVEYFLTHELKEHYMMTELHMPYDLAHKQADNIELQSRKARRPLAHVSPNLVRPKV